MRRCNPLTLIVTPGTGGTPILSALAVRESSREGLNKALSGGGCLSSCLAYIGLLAPILGGLMGGRTSHILDLLVRTDTFLCLSWGFRGVPYV